MLRSFATQKTSIMLKAFKIVAFLEGVSLLLLFFVAMPLKYIWAMPQLVSYVGMAHGVLFIMYLIMAFMLKSEREWTWGQLFEISISSIIPFGTFYIEKKYLKD